MGSTPRVGQGYELASVYGRATIQLNRHHPLGSTLSTWYRSKQKPPKQFLLWWFKIIVIRSGTLEL